jgi:hypothetical protein
MNVHDEIKHIKGNVQFDFYDTLTGKHDIVEVENVFCTAGKNSIADRLKGSDNVGLITYGALGTGATAPAAADIKLQTEIARKAVSVRSVAANVATFQTYFTTGEGNGSLKEAGLFGDLATDAADSGTLFCHTAINRTKSATDTLTLTWTVTIG